MSLQVTRQQMWYDMPVEYGWSLLEHPNADYEAFFNCLRDWRFIGWPFMTMQLSSTLCHVAYNSWVLEERFPTIRQTYMSLLEVVCSL